MILEWYRELFLFLWEYIGFFGGIVGISVIVSIVCFPIYNVIGRIVGMENTLQSVLNPAVAKIKNSYRDPVERQAAVERLYAHFGYHPIMGVRKVLPLFVSIPFLMFTYYMLAGTSELAGVKWLCFSDLSKPDGMLFGFNLLPFVMTAVNIFTVYATPCFNKKDEVQAWVIAIFFLVLLYPANTALMIYWTLNQLFNFGRTLCENHFSGLKLLASRLASFPHWIKSSIVDLFSSPIFSLTLLLIALYMRVMVYAEVWFWNCFLSRWFMCPVLALAIIVSGTILWRRVSRWFLIPAMLFAAIYCIAEFIALGLVPFTLKGMMFFTNNINVIHWFNGFLVFWLVLMAIPVLKAPVDSLKSLGRAFKENAHLLLLLVLLAIHYSYSSANFKLPIDSVAMLAVDMILPVLALLVVIIPAFTPYLSTGTVFKCVLGASLGAYLVPMISRETGGLLGYTTNLPIRLLCMAVLALVLVRLRKRTSSLVFMGLLLVAVIFKIFLGAHQLAAHNESAAPVQNLSAAEKTFTNMKAIRDSNIYLLVYDAYAHDKVLDTLGIKHMNLKKFLEPKGFTSYDAYAQGNDTVQSMAAAFSVGGVKQGSPRSMMVGNNVLNDFLQRSGYKTSYIVGAYDMPHREERQPGDFYFPVAQQVKRPENVLFPCIVKGILSQSANTFNSYTEDEWLGVKRDKIATLPVRRNFLYAHTDLPGHCVANPAYRKSDAEEQAGYANHLAKADREIVADVENVLARDPDAIIIVASDHGPYLTVPPKEFRALHLLDRCGIQLHVRWPTGYKPTLHVNCFSDVFLELLICMTGDTSLAQYRTDNATLHFQYPLSLSPGAVRDGVIQVGVDRGKRLVAP